MRMMLLDFHVHTRFSPDCLSSPDALLEAAKRRGLNGITVTDHDTIRGGLETRDRNRDPDFHVIVGSEIKRRGRRHRPNRLGKAFACGSDAHFLSDLGTCGVTVEDLEIL